MIDNLPTSFSHWEHDRWLGHIDVLIAGSGIVGLNAALQLKQQAPSLKIIVVERGVLPSGASTRNAGFACFGSCTELLDDLKRHTENEVFALVEKRYQGLLRLRRNLGDDAIRYEALGGYEIFDNEAEFSECHEKLAYLNRHIGPLVGETTVYRTADDQIQPFGFNGVQHLIQNTAEGQIDTGRMMEALIAKVRSLGVEILNGIEISGFSPEGDGVRIQTHNGFYLQTRRLLVCTNGFARQLLPLHDVEPARAQVLITAPLPGLRVRGAFHYDRGYYYFRNVGDRLLFGGGRNLDFETENTWEFGLTPLVQRKLEALLETMILPGTPYTIERRWSGIMGVGTQKSTILQKIDDHVYCAVRMGGMGVAIGSLVGEDAAKMVLAEI